MPKRSENEDDALDMFEATAVTVHPVPERRVEATELLAFIGDPASDPAASGMFHLGEENLVKGGISFGFTPHDLPDGRRAVGKLDAETVVFETVNPGETRVDHDLGRVPRRFVVVHKTGAVDVYRGTSTWTESVVYFSASAAAGAGERSFTWVRCSTCWVLALESVCRAVTSS